MRNIFFTGFPGFLGVELLPEVLIRQKNDVNAICLVQKKYMAYANKMRKKIEKENLELVGRIKIVEGDIRYKELGINSGSLDKNEVVEIYHLAAVYDLLVNRSLAENVNVNGTKNVLEIANKCKGLKRFHYVSTCYVSGIYNGLFKEEDLDLGQKFHNHYEESKFRAEKLVREAKANGLPTTIYRPSIAVGDSETGETQKFDGLYYVIQWILRLPKYFIFPVFKGAKHYKVNVIPRDFLVKAIVYLSGLNRSLGKTYQICDPRPFKTGRMVDVLADATGRKLKKIILPPFMAIWAVKHIKPLRRWLRMPPETLDCFKHPTYYSVENMMTDLKGSGIACPSFIKYVKTIVNYQKEHSEINSDAMV